MVNRRPARGAGGWKVPASLAHATRPLIRLVIAGHLPAGPRDEGGERDNVNVRAQEAHRAVAEQHVGAAGVERVGLARAVGAVDRVGVVVADVVAVGAVNGARPGKHEAATWKCPEKPTP